MQRAVGAAHGWGIFYAAADRRPRAHFLRQHRNKGKQAQDAAAFSHELLELRKGRDAPGPHKHQIAKKPVYWYEMDATSVDVLPRSSVTTSRNEYDPKPALNCTDGVAVFAPVIVALRLPGPSDQAYFR